MKIIGVPRLAFSQCALLSPRTMSTGSAGDCGQSQNCRRLEQASFFFRNSPAGRNARFDTRTVCTHPLGKLSPIFRILVLVSNSQKQVTEKRALKALECMSHTKKIAETRRRWSVARVLLHVRAVGDCPVPWR